MQSSDDDQQYVQISQPGPGDPIPRYVKQIHKLVAKLLDATRCGEGQPAYFDSDDETGKRTFVCFENEGNYDTLATIRVTLARTQEELRSLQKKFDKFQNLHDLVKSFNKEDMKPLGIPQVNPDEDLEASVLSPQATKGRPSLDDIALATRTPVIKVKTPGSQKPISKPTFKAKSRSNDPDEEYIDEPSDAETVSESINSAPKKRAAPATHTNTPKEKRAKVNLPVKEERNEEDKEEEENEVEEAEEPRPTTYTTTDNEVLEDEEFWFAHEVQAEAIKSRPFMFAYPENSQKMWTLGCPSKKCAMAGHTGWFIDDPLHREFARNHLMAIHKRIKSTDEIIRLGGVRVVPDLRDEKERAMSSKQFKKMLLSLNENTNEARKLYTFNRYANPDRADERSKDMERRAYKFLGERQARQEQEAKNPELKAQGAKGEEVEEEGLGKSPQKPVILL